MLNREFIEYQIKQLDGMLLETRETIERAMAVEEQLLAQRRRWLGKVGLDDQKPFLIGLPSLYVPEQRDGRDLA